MKQVWQKVLSIGLAACLAAGTLAMPASAASARAEPAGGVMETLLEVPILGDLIRLFTGAEESDDATATQETATREAATPETATGETAQSQATPETGRSKTVTAADWPESWMAGSIAPEGIYPAGDPDAARSLTVTAPLWSDITLGENLTFRAANREETNFGSLTADAVAYAVASTDVWQQNPDLYGLPLVTLVNGASLLETVPAGTTLDEINIGTYLSDDAVSLVLVTGDKLNDILNSALAQMLDSDSEQYGDFPQLSGLRVTYQSVVGNLQAAGAWLAGLDGETEVDRSGQTTRLALALPADLCEYYALTPENGYTDYLSVTRSAGQPSAAVTLQSALLDLPRNCDAATLAVLMGRQGSTGRILPVTAGTYSVRIQTTGTAAAGSVTVYVDGAAVTAQLAADGWLTIDGLTPGSHTIRLTTDGEARYVSSVTALGVASGTQLPALTQPEGWAQAVSTATPAPTPAPAASAQQQTTTTTTSSATPTPSPTPAAAPVLPAATATPRPARTAAPVEDPLEGTIIGVTPAPTLEPTPTPAPTPTPTPDPEEQQQSEQLRQASSMLPLYVGIGVLVIGAAILAVVLIRRRGEGGDKSSRYHARKK